MLFFRKKNLILSGVLLITFLFSEETKKNVGILKFQSKGLSTMEADIATDIFRNELVDNGKFQVLDRNNMQAILKEQEFQQTGCTDTACAVKLGKLLNMQFMINGTLLKAGSSIYLAVEVINVESGKIVKSAREKIESMDKLENGIKKIVSALTDERLKSKTDTFISKGAGVLKINCVSPKNAEVFINNDKKGNVPFNTELKAGKYDIMIFQDGYFPKKMKINLSEGESRNVEVSLIKGISKYEAKNKSSFYQKKFRKFLTYSLISGGIGAGGLLTGLIFSSKANSTYEKYSATDVSADAEELGKTLDREKAFLNSGLWTAIGAGSAAITFSVFTFIYGKNKNYYNKIHKKSKSAGIIITPDYSGICLNLSF